VITFPVSKDALENASQWAEEGSIIDQMWQQVKGQNWLRATVRIDEHDLHAFVESAKEQIRDLTRSTSDSNELHEAAEWQEMIEAAHNAIGEKPKCTIGGHPIQRLGQREYKEMLKSTFFDNVNSLIENPDIAAAVASFMERGVSDDFWEMASSGTGRWHPAYQNGFGGLARHSISCAKYARDYVLSTAKPEESNLSGVEQDCVVAACFMHDTSSPQSNHGDVAASSFGRFSELGEETHHLICVCIANHMGFWSEPSEPFQVNEQREFYACYATCFSDIIVSRNDYSEPAGQALAAYAPDEVGEASRIYVAMKDHAEPYHRGIEEWKQALLADAYDILVRVAGHGREVITYGQLAEELEYPLEPDSAVLRQLLDTISVEEDKHQRGLLSAVVVEKNTGLPRTEWFELASERGRITKDRRECWKNELEMLNDIWHLH